MVTSPLIQLANLGMTDSILLLILALVVFGPRKLPQIGRQIGKLMYEFRKASNDFKFQMEEELRVAEEADRRKKDEEERQRVAALTASTPSIEAQSDIGAVESTTTAQASPYPGEEVYPPVITPEAAAAPAEPQTVVLPRVGPVIQPPSTGETIAADKPGPAVSNIAETPAETAGSAEPPSESQKTESLSHNG